MAMSGAALSARIKEAIRRAGIVEEHTPESRRFWDTVSEAIVSYIKDNAEIIVRGECTVPTGIDVDTSSLGISPGGVISPENPTGLQVSGSAATSEEVRAETLGVGTLT